MRWLAFLFYLPVLAALSYASVTTWPRFLSWVYGAVTLAMAWRSFRIGKDKDHATPGDVAAAIAFLVYFAWRQSTISPP